MLTIPLLSDDKLNSIYPQPPVSFFAPTLVLFGRSPLEGSSLHIAAYNAYLPVSGSFEFELTFFAQQQTLSRVKIKIPQSSGELKIKFTSLKIAKRLASFKLWGIRLTMPPYTGLLGDEALPFLTSLQCTYQDKFGVNCTRSLHCGQNEEELFQRSGYFKPDTKYSLLAINGSSRPWIFEECLKEQSGALNLDNPLFEVLSSHPILPLSIKECEGDSMKELISLSSEKYVRELRTLMHQCLQPHFSAPSLFIIGRDSLSQEISYWRCIS